MSGQYWIVVAPLRGDAPISLLPEGGGRPLICVFNSEQLALAYIEQHPKQAPLHVRGPTSREHIVSVLEPRDISHVLLNPTYPPLTSQLRDINNL
jgi:hypothetical protein